MKTECDDGRLMDDMHDCVQYQALVLAVFGFFY
jgi:hypothetical protein